LILPETTLQPSRSELQAVRALLLALRVFADTDLLRQGLYLRFHPSAAQKTKSDKHEGHEPAPRLQQTPPGYTAFHRCLISLPTL
jgi:hypothetical protein